MMVSICLMWQWEFAGYSVEYVMSIEMKDTNIEISGMEK